jgi:hypothetical protein
MIVYYLIMSIWKILTAPFQAFFRAFFETEKSKIDRDIRIAKEKVAKREWLLIDRGTAFIDDNCNSIMNPVDIGKNDLDTDLMGVPNVYLKDCLGKAHINDAFLSYFENQVELHLTCPWGRRHKFLRTIRELYPEFTPRFSVISSEIKTLREDAQEGKLIEELYKEVRKMGVDKLTTTSLIEKYGDDPKKFKEELNFQLAWEKKHE